MMIVKIITIIIAQASRHANAENETAGLLASGATGVWDKPFPSFIDGSLQRRVAGLFEADRRSLDT